MARNNYDSASSIENCRIFYLLKKIWKIFADVTAILTRDLCIISYLDSLATELIGNQQLEYVNMINSIGFAPPHLSFLYFSSKYYSLATA